ncbi:hypothetical protein [Streptomyces sp. cg36]|uniref:hypothetical protein n=1 Tax=Streptomyces sp. cg36 TaxID=3238798 RepID=UPI0034E26457
MTSLPDVPLGSTPLPRDVRAAPARVAADLGFSAFAERNQSRYGHYVTARLSADRRVLTVVPATLAHARRHWDWLLSRPSPAADVWEELRYQVRRQSEQAPTRDARVAALYYRLPETSADSVLLCCRLGLAIREAAELMGLERPAVEAGLRVARRVLPPVHVGRRCS